MKAGSLASWKKRRLRTCRVCSALASRVEGREEGRTDKERAGWQDKKRGRFFSHDVGMEP